MKTTLLPLWECSFTNFESSLKKYSNYVSDSIIRQRIYENLCTAIEHKRTAEKEIRLFGSINLNSFNRIKDLINDCSELIAKHLEYNPCLGLHAVFVYYSIENLRNVIFSYSNMN